MHSQGSLALDQVSLLGFPINHFGKVGSRGWLRPTDIAINSRAFYSLNYSGMKIGSGPRIRPSNYGFRDRRVTVTPARNGRGGRLRSGDRRDVSTPLF